MPRSSGSPDIKHVLLEERLIGYLDPGAEKFLKPINEGGLTTTSSCTGRITIVDGKWHWLRDRSRIVFKTHTEISPVDLAYALAGPYDDLWLKVTGPIVHAKAPSLDCAAKVLQAARDAGFKHSGAISLGEEVVLELISAVQITVPLKREGVILVNPTSIYVLARTANEALRDGWRRLERLSGLLSQLGCQEGS
ncbi:MAG: hypothetical protein RXN29_01645 [Acidilobus sp.]|nr:hypothetical protein [Acidilobus sp.]MCG2889217.1 hypothetical protein [Acidilobus sp.]MCG2890801.1 hypothetical protein [Acidilobus sp.]